MKNATVKRNLERAYDSAQYIACNVPPSKVDIAARVLRNLRSELNTLCLLKTGEYLTDDETKAARLTAG